MNDEMKALAERAVACKHWRWLPGMLDDQGQRVLEVSKTLVITDHIEYPEGYCIRCGAEHEAIELAEYARLPDLTDPATLGCLLHLVREAWRGSPRWLSIPWDGEAETLVAALEAADE